jgi:hypothetical protein
MTRSRLVVFLASIVVVGGVLAAAGALYLDPARAAVGPLPAFGLALPADTRFVVGFDVQRLTASPFYERYARGPASMRPDAFRDLEERTGLKPERDLERVVIAGRPLTQKGAALALVQGRFDRTKLSLAIENEKAKSGGAKGVTWKNQSGTTVYMFSEGHAGAFALAFLADDTLVMGDQAGVEATLANQVAGTQSLRGNADLMALLEAVKPGSTFWMVGDKSLLAQMPRSIPAPGGAPAPPGAPGAGVNLPALKSLVVTGDLEPQVTLDVTGEAGDEAGARNLADLARGFVALLSLQASQKPELKDLASAFSITSEGPRVRLSGRVPYEMLDALQPKKAPDPAPPAAR